MDGCDLGCAAGVAWVGRRPCAAVAAGRGDCVACAGSGLAADCALGAGHLCRVGGAVRSRRSSSRNCGHGCRQSGHGINRGVAEWGHGCAGFGGKGWRQDWLGHGCFCGGTGEGFRRMAARADWRSCAGGCPWSALAAAAVRSNLSAGQIGARAGRFQSRARPRARAGSSAELSAARDPARRWAATFHRCRASRPASDRAAAAFKVTAAIETVGRGRAVAPLGGRNQPKRGDNRTHAAGVWRACRSD